MYRTLVSHAYSPPPRSSSSKSPSDSEISKSSIEATTETPGNLTEEQRKLVERIIRVDHAGELGANWIYRGQKWAMDVKGDSKTARQVEVCNFSYRGSSQKLIFLVLGNVGERTTSP